MQGYINKHAGKTAIVIGKGPTLDKWIQDGKPRPDGAIVIGVNNIGDIAKVDYTFCTDDPDCLAKNCGTAFVGIPYSGGHTHKKKQHEWFLHCHDILREGTALRQSREQCASHRWLYTASSSIQPAIHFAWLCGCAELLMVGIGGNGYSNQFKGSKTQSTDDIYKILYEDTKRAANVLFGKKWRHMYEIA